MTDKFDIQKAIDVAAQIEADAADHYEKTGGSAFPWSESAPGGETRGGAFGMTLRDWFAGQALAHANREIWSEHKFENVANRAYFYADAMLEARKR